MNRIPLTKYRRSTVCIFAIAGFIAVSTVLFGWSFDVPGLISITPNMTAMNPVTALTLLLIYVWLFVRCIKSDSALLLSVEVAVAVIILLVGTWKMIEYAGLTEIHIDRLLFSKQLNMRFLHNAIAPTTAYLFISCSILLLNSYRTNEVSKIINDVILLISFLVAYLGIIGYIYSLEPFYRIGPFVPMALNTACCFIIALSALFVGLPQGYFSRAFFSKHIGGKLVRRALPMVLLIPAAFGYSKLLLQRAKFYNVEYSISLDTAFIVFAVLLLLFFYAHILNREDYKRKESEKAVVQSENRFKSLIYSLNEGIISYDTKGVILYYNPSFSLMTGYTEKELIGKIVSEALVPEEFRQELSSRMGARLQGQSEEYESEIIHKDGTRIIVSISAVPVIKDGKIASVLSTITDITERKKKEEDIEAFSASAAHDLNAPLNRIQSLSNFILEAGEDHLTADDIEYLEIIVKTATDMRMLLKDLLFFSKVGAEKVSKAAIDMNVMVKEIIAAAPESTARIQVDELPAGQGDRSTIKQVWTNLIHNAIKYSSKKDQPEIQIGSTLVNGKCVYFVKDNGAGFNMSESWKLFAPFKRLHSDFEGNGLGLPIVKRIVEKHGGKIWAESEKDKGATFYFTI